MITLPTSVLLERLAASGLLTGTTGQLPDHISGLSSDSRAIRPGDAFVALRGTNTDGHRFIHDATSNGASIIILESASEEVGGTPQVLVSDSAQALGLIASSLHGDAASALRMIGITGTNGKTTTAWLIAQSLNALGESCGFIGTIGYGDPLHLREASHTTPGAVRLHRLLDDGRRAGWQACAIEMSSHALQQQRAAGVEFQAGVFTNLTHEHLDYHGTIEEYARAKSLLFSGLSSSASAVLNVDSPYWSEVVGTTDASRMTYGQSRDADVVFRIMQDEPQGLMLDLDGQQSRFRLAGTFNASNLAAAYATLLSLGHSAEACREALSNAIPAPGRFEPVMAPNGRRAIVDYAHTPDALVNVLKAARRTTSGALWCVFGCGGERDRTKRPIMAQAAETLADRLVLTSDNPRSEAPHIILSEMVGGLKHPGQAAVIEDRRAAIEHALEMADEQDLVVVAGKGHETYQVLADRTIDFDDREIIRNAPLHA